MVRARFGLTRQERHPVFGPFDAHHWPCMFAFHLQIHLRQAEAVVRLAGEGCGPVT